MLSLPDKINGYTILAAMPKMRGTNPPSFDPDEAMILGQDLTRRHSKWVVATVSTILFQGEWYWGFYTDHLPSAIDQFIAKTNIKLALETT